MTGADSALVDMIAEVQQAHERKNGIRNGAIHCTCGWSESVRGMRSSRGSYAAHQARAVLDAISEAGFGNQHEAFAQGQKSGMRHADRLAAANKIGRPDLPGPLSTNPYPKGKP